MSLFSDTIKGRQNCLAIKESFEQIGYRLKREGYGFRRILDAEGFPVGYVRNYRWSMQPIIQPFEREYSASGEVVKPFSDVARAFSFVHDAVKVEWWHPAWFTQRAA